MEHQHDNGGDGLTLLATITTSRIESAVESRSAVEQDSVADDASRSDSPQQQDSVAETSSSVPTLREIRLVPRNHTVTVGSNGANDAQIREAILNKKRDTRAVTGMARGHLQHMIQEKAIALKIQKGGTMVNGVRVGGDKVMTFDDVCQSLHEDHGLQNAELVWHCLFGQFDNEAWVDNMESKIMKALGWEYDGKVETFQCNIGECAHCFKHCLYSNNTVHANDPCAAVSLIFRHPS